MEIIKMHVKRGNAANKTKAAFTISDCPSGFC